MTEGPTRGGTAPLGIAAVGANAPTAPEPPPEADVRVKAAHATQVSASAIPSTLESAQGPPPPTVQEPARTPTKRPPPLALTVDDVDGAALNDAAMREIARREIAAHDAPDERPAGPPTLVSPGGVGAPFPYPPAPPQIPPAYEEPREAPPALASFAPPALHGTAPPPPMQMATGQPPRRGMSGTTIALIIVGVMLVIGAGAGVIGVTVFVLEARRDKAEREARRPPAAAPLPTVTTPPATATATAATTPVPAATTPPVVSPRAQPPQPAQPPRPPGEPPPRRGRGGGGSRSE